MKCQECDWYQNNQCKKAEKLEISSIDDPICLARIQIMFLRDIWIALQEQNEEGEGWKDE
mgnify:CR=1 FL=1